MANKKGFFRISNLNELQNLYKYGYRYDWTKRSSSNTVTIVYADCGSIAGAVEFERQPGNQLNHLFLLEVADDFKGIAVAGKLLAYVADDALGHGYMGFTFAEPRAVMFQYYQTKYGAKPLVEGSHTLWFDTEAMNALIGKYLTEDN